MARTKEHYDELLGPVYAWMVGDLEAASSAAVEWFISAGVLPDGAGQAVDLGCGHGVQSIPLAKAGYDVIAIDTCDHLLNALRGSGVAGIRTVNDDLRSFQSHLSCQPQAIVCMGDTLTHLASESEAMSLVRDAAGALTEGGHLCLGFRDYTGVPLEDSDRFIPVRFDDSRLHTCLLEDAGNHVRVTDLVHSRSEGGWQQAVGSYLKAKVAPAAVKQAAIATGLVLTHEERRRGMCFLGFRRSSSGSA